ncbi:L-2-amino-thiazoline-4-carboxylic acid hydrolase [Ruminococcus sp.]|uniref:L-2-amino-thiazoline-4-carboxylic acid hydrolase n=1 Tax=Ruminococcus sp. TaxID=41978 RepID=UPI0025EA976E|nr:L-2-amino-thiazoline-4-carboxylic acid hydrolase [Ruminococcus sp.]MBQ8966608.1 L-2-amino-thiazoline-4-carboxylic acid hydrolase [Ruminococcus sp.]
MKKYIPAKMVQRSRFVTYFDSRDKKWQQGLLDRISQLIKENPEYCDSGNYGHLCNLLTSLAMVQQLEGEGLDRSEAVKTVAEAMYKFIEPQIASMKKLAGHGWFVPFLKLTMPLKFRMTLGFGWEVEFPKCPRDTFSMTTHKCIYQQIFAKYGMPEMTAVFCKVDDILYSDLPRAAFTYTQQIGNGGKMCDYSYKKR